MDVWNQTHIAVVHLKVLAPLIRSANQHSTDDLRNVRREYIEMAIFGQATVDLELDAAPATGRRHRLTALDLCCSNAVVELLAVLSFVCRMLKAAGC